MLPSQLVIAHYQENLDWVSKVPEGIDIVVYNKFLAEEGNFLPNIGRETHTYLHHILLRWDDLPPTIAFVQGNPSEHTANLIGKLANVPEGTSFGNLCDQVVADDGSGQPWAWGIPFDKWYKIVFEQEKGLDYYAFGSGAQFVVSREAIQRRPRSFYERIMAIISDPEQTWEFGYTMERFWYYVFHLDHTKHPRRTDHYNPADIDVNIRSWGSPAIKTRIIDNPTPSVGVVVGSYGAPAYIHLHLESRKRWYPNVPMLIHDDSSSESAAIEELCQRYGASFYKTPCRLGHQEGDLSAGIMGIVFCYDKGLDLAVKFSRTFIPTNNFVPELQYLAFGTQYMTYGNGCESCRSGFDTFALAWHARSYVEYGLLEKMTEGLKLRREMWGCVEDLLHHLARSGMEQYACTFNNQIQQAENRPPNFSGYGIWDWIGADCTRKIPNRIWHTSDNAMDYYQLSSSYGLPYTIADFAAPPQ